MHVINTRCHSGPVCTQRLNALCLSRVFIDSNIYRCELTSNSYLLRKNRNRTDVSRRVKSGPRLDGILRDVNDRSYEFCAIEGAPLLSGGTISTKWLRDKAKLRKALRDIISRLAIEANHERRVVEDLQVVGISTAALTMQVSRMTHRKGYVCMLAVDRPLTIPHDVRQLRKLLVFLAAFVRIKVCIYLAHTSRIEHAVG